MSILIGPVFSLKNIESHVGHIEQEVWDEIRQLQVGLTTKEGAAIKEFNLMAHDDINAATQSWVRYTARLGVVVFREYSKLDKALWTVFSFFGRIVNKVRGL